MSDTTPTIAEPLACASVRYSLIRIAVLVVCVAAVVAVRRALFDAFGLYVLSGQIALGLMQWSVVAAFHAQMVALLAQILIAAVVIRIALQCTRASGRSWRLSLASVSFSSIALVLLVIPVIGQLAGAGGWAAATTLHLRRNGTLGKTVSALCGVVCGTLLLLSQYLVAAPLLGTAMARQLPAVLQSMPPGDQRLLHALTIARALQSFANARGGAYPDHPIQMAISPMFLGAGVFKDLGGDAPQRFYARSGSWSMHDVFLTPAGDRARRVAAVVDDLPAELVTSRLGGLIVIRGLRRDSPGDLWVVLLLKPPQSEPWQAEGSLVAITAGGQCITVAAKDISGALLRQNGLRESNGLAPIALPYFGSDGRSGPPAAGP